MANGTATSTDVAVAALRRMAEVEFGGPTARTQLLRLRPDITDPETIDELIWLRQLVPRRAASPGPGEVPTLTWNEWLDLADLLGEGLRAARGTSSVAVDGHHCRSMLERHIDDYLYSVGIAHTLEPPYPYHEQLNPHGMRADWLLDDGRGWVSEDAADSTFIEAFGMLAIGAYRDKVDRKRELADEAGIPLVEVTADDLHRLPEILSRWKPRAPRTH